MGGEYSLGTYTHDAVSEQNLIQILYPLCPFAQVEDARWASDKKDQTRAHISLCLVNWVVAVWASVEVVEMFSCGLSTNDAA